MIAATAVQKAQAVAISLAIVAVVGLLMLQAQAHSARRLKEIIGKPGNSDYKSQHETG